MNSPLEMFQGTSAFMRCKPLGLQARNRPAFNPISAQVVMGQVKEGADTAKPARAATLPALCLGACRLKNKGWPVHMQRFG